MKQLTSYPYPGGKTKSINLIAQYFPKRFNEFRDVFTGGGSMAIHVMTNYPHVKVWINDLYYPIYCFWRTLQLNPDALIQWLFQQCERLTVKDLKELCVYCVKTLHSSKNEMETGGRFFLGQKLSYSGLGTLPALYQCSMFSVSSIVNLHDLATLIRSRQVTITNLSYSDCLEGDADTLIFADPPYKINRFIYGNKGSTHRGFQHKQFCKTMMACRSPWLITYNDMPNLRKWLDGSFICPMDIKYTMSGTGVTMGQELLISNYDVFTARTCSTELGRGC